MKNTLRNILMTAVAVATVAVAATSAVAESKVNVPFSFVVAGKTYPAGQYSINKDLQSNIITLRNADASLSYMCGLRPGDPAPTDTAVRVKFDQINKKHALRSIEYGPLATSRLDKGVDTLEHGTMTVIEGQ